MALIGLATGDYTVIVAGFPFIIMPVLGIFVYGLLGKLGAIIYNTLAQKFGGLELEFDDMHEN